MTDPAAIAASLTDAQKNVLFQLGEDIGQGPSHIAATLRISIPEARETLLFLHREGLCDFGALFDDDGLLAGKGYWIDSFGESVRNIIQEQSI